MSGLPSNVTRLALHPYYPIGAELPRYEVNKWSVPTLLTLFFGTCALLSASTYSISKLMRPSLTKGERITITWFVLSGAIHIVFEGYYATNQALLATKQTILGQLWKEYAFSDSRYLTHDSFVLTMETVTAVFWGPGCLLIAALIVQRHPLRHPVQMIVSMGQLYGVVLYYATSIFDHYWNGIIYSRPEMFYYWFYFVFMNFFWFIIPGVLIYQSVVKVRDAIAATQQLPQEKTPAANYSVDYDIQSTCSCTTRTAPVLNKGGDVPHKPLLAARTNSFIFHSRMLVSTILEDSQN